MITIRGTCMGHESSGLAEPFEIVSVKRSEPPQGLEGADWYRYIIGRGVNTINGHRQGSLSAVTTAVEEITAQLNERRLGKRGRVDLVPTPKKNTGK